jgi:hypothetical protein
MSSDDPTEANSSLNFFDLSDSCKPREVRKASKWLHDFRLALIKHPNERGCEIEAKWVRLFYLSVFLRHMCVTQSEFDSLGNPTNAYASKATHFLRKELQNLSFEERLFPPFFLVFLE